MKRKLLNDSITGREESSSRSSDNNQSEDQIYWLQFQPEMHLLVGQLDAKMPPKLPLEREYPR